MAPPRKCSSCRREINRSVSARSAARNSPVARTEVLACTRICARVRAAVSEAKSASRIALSLDVTFSNATERLFDWYPGRPSEAHRCRPRKVETWSMASSMIFCAWTVLPPTSEFAPPLPRLDRNPSIEFPSLVVETESIPMSICPWRFTSEPIWNLAPPPVMAKLVPGRIDGGGEILVERQGDVQIAGAQRSGQAIHFGFGAVDVDRRILAMVLVVDERSGDRFDADVLTRAVGGGVKLQAFRRPRWR